MALWRKKPSPAPTPRAPSDAQQASSENLVGPDPGLGLGVNPLLSGDPQADGQSLDVLLEAIRQVSESRDVESLLNYVVDTAVHAMGAERGFLIFTSPVDDRAGELSQQVRVARSAGADLPTHKCEYSTSVVQRVVQSAQPIRTMVDNDAQALEWGQSVLQLKLRGVMCAPLAPHGAGPGGRPQHGALYVDSRVTRHEFTARDLALFSALTQHVDVALENARLHEESLEKARLTRSLEIATEIQAGLMPSAPPVVPGFDLHGWFRPAEHATGDFYDFVRLGDGRHAFVVGDVTGHGIGPALVTATAQAGLRSYLRILNDPAQVISLLNADLAERMDDGMFLTLFLGVVGEDGRLEYVNAGGTPPLLWRHETQSIQELESTGPALGLVEGMQFELGPPTQMQASDTLLAFTDGVVEARHPERPDDLFGNHRVQDLVARVSAADPSAEALLGSLVTEVIEFAAGVHEDDMTLVVLRRGSEPKG